MRRVSLFLLFLLLFLVLGSLLVAAPVRAETSYYALSFDGEDDYVDTAVTLGTEGTIIILMRPQNMAGTKDEYFISSYENSSNFFTIENNDAGNTRWGWRIDGTDYRIYTTHSFPDGHFLAAYIWSTTAREQKLYFNTELIATKEFPSDVYTMNEPLDIARLTSGSGYFDGKIYLILIYNRALSDEEIQAIYNDPPNPPQDGLVLWLAPDSVDTANGVWHDKSGNGNDGTIHGATPERVSIPSLLVYDAVNGTPISPLNVSLALIANNTTTQLIPSLPVLPWNETVTLNVSATGYYERLITTWTGIDSLAVYLQPMPGDNTTSNLNPPNWTVNYTVEEINGTGWSGWQVGKAFLELKLDKAVELFFTENPNSKAEVIVPFVVWIGFTIAALVFSQSPGVAIVIGAVTQVSLAGIGAKLDMRLLPGAAVLYLFLFIWVLKDFIETFRKD